MSAIRPQKVVEGNKESSAFREKGLMEAFQEDWVKTMMKALAEGTIRRLWACDMSHFRDHLLRLDPDSRFERFGAFTDDTQINHYVDSCYGPDEIIYGYVVDGEVRGAGELRAMGASFLPEGAAEAAFSVEQGWRRQGVGTNFMKRIVLAARNRRIHTLYLSCLAHNSKMVGLARKFATELTFETDEVTGKLIARTPSTTSLIEELIDNSVGFTEAMFDFQKRILTAAEEARHPSSERHSVTV
ncbi:GNAT family N-acetyltransferase [Beijerinckia indica]|uniref:GCN5-related N-acetyltransferase n=1 Tax=Beijerinckia indica subsp. indica (strain ATCC 9039 / DSM 1715 / NCIMB 8712) TaxID=395963 RepID=B2IDC0_BEII9|nr:GNAT family N-acetyltransferase [Beijerinckia indica]ACB94022.1 GCN5-related N-acetyltransferase [Beijerinckia indica subsp. indica ATCC 9039]